MTQAMVRDPRIRNAAMPVLFHPDLHTTNIFVSDEDPRVITAIIDWQSASIEPAFWHADQLPDFATPIPDQSDEDKLEPKSEACVKVFDVSIQHYAQKLAIARAVDDSLYRPLRYCHRTWGDGATAFHEELIQTARQWEQLGFEAACPFPLPAPDEITIHRKNYRLLEAAQQLKEVLADVLNNFSSDGWVPTEDWNSAELAHQAAFEGIKQEILADEHPDEDEPLKCEDDLREIWPFELKEKAKFERVD